MGGKGKTPAAPDYTPIAAANEESTRISAEVAREQLAWAKETYKQDKEVSDRIVNQLLGTMDSESAASAADRERYQQIFQPVEDQFVRESQEDRQRYENVFRPIEDQMISDAREDRQVYRDQVRPLEQQLFQEAATYNTQERQDAESARMASDVAMTFDAQRKAAMADLEGYGVDPSQARAGALDTGVRMMQAAASLSAQNQGRQQVEDTGRMLREQAINLGGKYQNAQAAVLPLAGNLAGGTANAVNLGRGYPGQIASGYQTAQGAGQSAIGSQLGTTASGANTMGTAQGWQGLSNQALGNWGNQVVSLNNTSNQIRASNQQAQSSMIGNVVGTVAGVALGAMTGGAGLAAMGALGGAGAALGERKKYPG